jgi:sortase A
VTISRAKSRFQRTRWQRLCTSIGVALVVIGLVWAGWLAWQYLGTPFVAKKEHAAITEKIQDSWREDRKGTRVKDRFRADYFVRIPKFGDSYAVPILRSTSDEALALGFGQFVDSEDPGEVGNFTLAAHRVTHGEPLRDMPSLEAGDEVIVETKEAVYTYTLDTPGDGLTVDFTASWVLADRPENPKRGGIGPVLTQSDKLITLTTCSELFNTDNRLIAFGHLSNRRTK